MAIISLHAYFLMVFVNHFFILEVPQLSTSVEQFLLSQQIDSSVRVIICFFNGCTSQELLVPLHNNHEKFELILCASSDASTSPTHHWDVNVDVR
jgi:hypothetical protein